MFVRVVRAYKSYSMQYSYGKCDFPFLWKSIQKFNWKLLPSKYLTNCLAFIGKVCHLKWLWESKKNSWYTQKDYPINLLLIKYLADIWIWGKRSSMGIANWCSMFEKFYFYSFFSFLENAMRIDSLLLYWEWGSKED